MFTQTSTPQALNNVTWVGGPIPEPERLETSNPKLHELLVWVCQENGKRLNAGLPTLQKTPVTAEAKTGRNEPCPCGSGLKYKKCCGK